MAKNTSTAPVTSKPRRHTLKRLIAYILQDKIRLWAVIIAAGLATYTMVLGPKILGQATTAIFEGLISKMLPAGVTKEQAIEGLKASGHESMVDMVASMDIHPGSGVDFTHVVQILALAGAVFICTVLLRWIQGWSLTRLVSNAVHRMRKQIEEKLDRLPLSYFDRVPRGEVMSRTTNDVDNIGQTLQQVLGEFIFSVFTVVGVIIMMLTIAPVLTAVSLIVIPVILLAAYLVIRAAQPHFFKQWSATGTVNAHVEEMFTGHMVIRAYGQESHVIEEFDKRNRELAQASYKAQALSGTTMPLTQFFGNVNFVMVVIFGGIKVLHGTMTLGDLQAFSQYVRQMNQPLGQLSSMATMLQGCLASAERIFEFLDEPEEEAESDSQPDVLAGRTQGLVQFDHVKFRYDEHKPLIEDLSFTAQPGQTIAIVGPTGAGKTTLVNLLMRFYEIQGGTIAIDGVSTRDLTRTQLRRHFGMVLQDTWLFDGTIRENLVYGTHEEVSEERLLEAARATHVDDFVRRLPQGYDTVLTQDSSELSLGERQLLTICRAFLSQPDILILDEATSSVDTRTETLVQHAMNELRKGRTSFVIAHRLSTIRDADCILVVNHGAIVEQGTHDELLAKQGAYAELYQAQFAGAVEE